LPDLDPDDRHFELTEILLRELRNYMGKRPEAQWDCSYLVRVQQALHELSLGHLDYIPTFNSSDKQGLDEPNRRQAIANHAHRLALRYQETNQAEALSRLQQAVYDLVATHRGISAAWLRAECELLDKREGRLLLSQVDG
jgi:hypothetical protein